LKLPVIGTLSRKLKNSKIKSSYGRNGAELDRDRIRSERVSQYAAQQSGGLTLIPEEAALEPQMPFLM